MKSVADWLQRGYTEAVLMETGMRRNECMKRLSKVSCGLLLTASLLIGAMLSGCGQTTDYTAEIREYQNKLESLAAENEELKAQLGITETQSTEETQTAAETENQSQEMVSENQTTKTDVQQAENTDNSGDEMKILVLGDSIWGNYRDDTGVSARLAACLAQEGKNATSEAGNSVVQFNTAHKHIQGCRACDNCFSKENKACIFNDDFNELASLMAESDVIIFCTPLYWYSFPTQIKAAIDKFYSFIIGKKDVPIKECMLLSCGELEDPHVFDGIVRSFELIAQDRGWKNRGHYLVNSVNEKGAISNTEHLQKIYDIGKKF